MFFEFFKVTGLSVLQSFLLAGVGYFLIKRDIVKEEGLDILSRLVIEITLPAMIFFQLIKGFSFGLYHNWWIFPLISLVITAAGLLVGLALSGFFKNKDFRLQFLNLVTFQNSGYLPLVLAAGMLPKDKAETFFIYIFLFLLGFNFALFSLGVFIFNFQQKKKFDWKAFLNPPVTATLASLLFVFFGLNKFAPEVVLKPLSMIGNCTLPLAMFVLGGNLAQIKLKHLDAKAIALMSLAKLIVLPLAGLIFLNNFKVPELVGLLIIMQLSMPPAALLSVLSRHHKKEDLLISQGIFCGHIIGLFTIPVFLSLYFIISVVK